MAPLDLGVLDRQYAFAQGVVLATAGLLEHEGLEAPEPRFIDVGDPMVPEASKGGCGCQGLVVAIKGGAGSSNYTGKEPVEEWTRYEVKVHLCRASISDKNMIGSLGPLDGSVANSINGATLDTMRHYAAIRRHLPSALRGLSGCAGSIKCGTIQSVSWTLSRTDACNVVGARFEVRI